MTNLERWRIVWSGSAVVGGGISTHYFATPTASVSADVNAYYTAMLKYLPPSVSVDVPSSGDTIDSATGNIVGTWSHAGGAHLLGTCAVSTYAAGVGARVVWNTLGRTNNRLVRGSTFFVPLASNQYETDGSIVGATNGDFKFRSDTLITAQSGSLHIWSRPSSAGASDGHTNSAVNASAPDKVSWLRSRRT